MRSPALDIGTRAGLTQAWIGYGWGIRSSQGRSNQATIPMITGLIFMTISPTAGGFPDGLAGLWSPRLLCQRAAQDRDSRHYVKPSALQ